MLTAGKKQNVESVIFIVHLIQKRQNCLILWVKSRPLLSSLQQLAIGPFHSHHNSQTPSRRISLPLFSSISSNWNFRTILLNTIVSLVRRTCPTLHILLLYITWKYCLLIRGYKCLSWLLCNSFHLSVIFLHLGSNICPVLAVISS